MPDDPRSPRSPLRALGLAWAGAVGGALAGLAGALLLVVTRRAIDPAGGLTPLEGIEAWRGSAPLQASLGAAGGLWVHAVLGRFRGSWLASSAGVALVLGLILTDLGGTAPPSLLAGSNWATRHLARAEVLLLVLLATALHLLLAPSLRRLRTRSLLGALGTAAVLLAALPPTSRELLAAPPGEVLVTEVVQEPALEPASWTVERAHPEEPPHAGVLSPTRDHRLDGGDLPSIVLPPPARLSFRVDAQEGPVHLRLAAGADAELDAPRVQRELRRLSGGEPFGIVFRVLRNGVVVAVLREPSTREELAREGQRERRWLRPAEDAPLDFEPGDLVTLETEVVGLDPAASSQVPPLPVGFGGLALERSRRLPGQRATPERPNLVLIVQDTLRADRTSTHGYARPTTPNLTRLAERGVRYSAARSPASWTWPATASLLTGLSPEAHGVTDDDSCYLAAKNRTLAEALRARGLVTAAFACNPLISARRNFSQGFAYFRDDPQRFVKTDEILADVGAWLRAHRETRFFLYLHLVDPHLPLTPRPEDVAALAVERPANFQGTAEETFQRFQRMSLGASRVDGSGAPIPATLPHGHLEYISSLYDAAVATGDHYLGLLLDELGALGLEDRTVVAFTSDHGEAHYEHHDLAHGQSLHRELIEVPLVLAGPGIPRGVVCDTPVSTRHLAPTLAMIGGAALEALSDPVLLTDPDGVPTRPVFSATEHGKWNYRPGRQPLLGVRDGRWVLHHAPTGTDFRVPAEEAGPEGQWRLYDLERDPWEQRDLAAREPAVARRLVELVREDLARQRAARASEVRLGGGSGTLELLDDIGYTIGKE